MKLIYVRTTKHFLWVALSTNEMENSHKVRMSGESVNQVNPQTAEKLRELEEVHELERGHGWISSLVQRMDELEAPIVRRVASISRRLSLLNFSVLVNRLANGWMYLIVGVLLITLKGWHSARPAAASLVSVALCLILYTIIKPRLARRRPCDVDSALSCPEKPLDRYSFPSGHCMMAVAVAIPIGWAFPSVIPAVTLFVVIIGWARLTLAHHYPSDLIIGCIIGAGISLGVSAFFFDLLRFWPRFLSI